uniref:Arf-GAP domain-containing protein n=1 Tax=Mucochytrium quahogii TaxID=96639 RepID=A0A7S2WAG4_9STRA|mmetsp:Transcript_17706/g.38759  ORF Transcript_17706/g.38759 Transcript_17706/m.38759 type:complete len:340 (+) Transcript_17706:108-1127(+)
MEFQKELRSLIRTVPGNNVCVDCREPNPTWASVNLGIFMCLACSGIHRAMGVHISFVKSTTLDKWTAEFVANMKNGGNERANKFFEAELPPGYPRPSTMRDREAFIRDKYQHRKWVATNSTMARRASSDGESVADTSPAVTSGGGRRKRIPPSQRRLQMKEKKADMPLPDSSVDLLGEGGEKGSAIASSDSMFANMSIKVSADPPAVSAPKEQTGVSSPVNDLLSFGMEEPEPASNNGSILDSFGTTEKSSENILANFGVVPQSSNGNASASFSSADIMSQYTANGTGHQVSHDGFHNLTMAPPHQHQGDVQTMLNGSAPHNHNQPHMVQNDDQANSLR